MLGYSRYYSDRRFGLLTLDGVLYPLFFSWIPPYVRYTFVPDSLCHIEGRGVVVSTCNAVHVQYFTVEDNYDVRRTTVGALCKKLSGRYHSTPLRSISSLSTSSSRECITLSKGAGASPTGTPSLVDILDKPCGSPRLAWGSGRHQ